MASAYHNHAAQTPAHALRASDRLRAHWLAYQGRTGISRRTALEQIQWTHPRPPKWIGSGHIPDEWAGRIARQIGADLEQITAA